MKNEELEMQNFGQSEHGEVVIYQSSDGQARLDVHLAEETAWLTQAQMVELFEKTKQNISLHIRNIFKERELSEKAVVKEYLTTAADGKRYRTKFYNLGEKKPGQIYLTSSSGRKVRLPRT